MRQENGRGDQGEGIQDSGKTSTGLQRYGHREQCTGK